MGLARSTLLFALFSMGCDATPPDFPTANNLRAPWMLKRLADVNGKPAWFINCGAVFGSRAYCDSRANALCPNGYEELERGGPDGWAIPFQSGLLLGVTGPIADADRDPMPPPRPLPADFVMRHVVVACQ
jgi:hypothetical protein